MGVVSKYNKVNPFSYINTDGFNYVELQDIKDTVGDKPYKIEGLYINPKGKFGDEPVAIGDHILINLPRYLVEDVRDMLQDDEVINAIKAGKVGITVGEYTNDYSKSKDGSVRTFFNVQWIDL